MTSELKAGQQKVSLSGAFLSGARISLQLWSGRFIRLTAESSSLVVTTVLLVSSAAAVRVKVFA